MVKRLTLVVMAALALVGCKPGDYTARIATGNSPEETARGAVVQATADAAQEANFYTENLHAQDIADRALQSDLRAEAARVQIQTGITTSLMTAAATQNVIVEKGKAQADAFRALGNAGAFLVATIGNALSFSLYVLWLYLFVRLALLAWLTYRRVPVAANAVQLLGPNGLPSNFVLLRDGKRLYIQDVLTGARGDVRHPAEVNAIRAQLLLGAAQSEPSHEGVIGRAWAWLFGRRRQTVITPTELVRRE